MGRGNLLCFRGPLLGSWSLVVGTDIIVVTIIVLRVMALRGLVVVCLIASMRGLFVAMGGGGRVS